MSERFRIRLDEAVENAMSQPRVSMILGEKSSIIQFSEGDHLQEPFDLWKAIEWLRKPLRDRHWTSAVYLSAIPTETEIGDDVLPSEVDFNAGEGVIVGRHYISNNAGFADSYAADVVNEETRQFRNIGMYNDPRSALWGALEYLGVES